MRLPRSVTAQMISWLQRRQSWILLRSSSIGGLLEQQGNPLVFPGAGHRGQLAAHIPVVHDVAPTLEPVPDKLEPAVGVVLVHHRAGPDDRRGPDLGEPPARGPRE